jgi:hypothetical protein
MTRKYRTRVRNARQACHNRVRLFASNELNQGYIRTTANISSRLYTYIPRESAACQTVAKIALFFFLPSDGFFFFLTKTTSRRRGES